MRAINELCGLPGLVAMGFIPIKPILKNPEATSPTQPVQFLKQKELSLLREKGIVGDNLDFKSHRIITHLSLVWIFFLVVFLHHFIQQHQGSTWGWQERKVSKASL